MKLSRVFRRIILWFKIIKSFRGLTLKSEINLFISAVFDIIITLFRKMYNPYTLFSGVYVMKPYDIIVYTRGNTEDIYHVLPEREGNVHKILFSLIKPGDIFVDIGANIGYYTLLASKMGARVILL